MSDVNTNPTQHWKQYQLLLDKYINLLANNPYVNELKLDFINKQKKRFCSYYRKDFKDWIFDCIEKNIITKNIIDLINFQFSYNHILQNFSNYVSEKVNIDDTKTLINLFSIESIDHFNKVVLPKFDTLKLSPSSLKFVTTTAIAYLNVNVDFKKFYSRFTPCEDILNKGDNHVYKDHMIGKIAGCKTGALPIKGVFKKDTLGDFYNCATINVVLSNTKDTNVKIFNNGKLQMTGIPKPESGIIVCDYICKILEQMFNEESPDCENSIIIKDNNETSKPDFTLKSYKTVMINTCYEIGHYIDRESLYKKLVQQYNLNAIYDSEGYPGVRLEYYYNTNTVKTEDEGKCICKEKCKGKGTGIGINQCRKISIAIFQSGSAIIAGGCSTAEPIYDAYRFINNILSEILPEIVKTDKLAKNNKKAVSNTFIKIDQIKNRDVYDKLIKLKQSILDQKNNINLTIKLNF